MSEIWGVRGRASGVALCMLCGLLFLATGASAQALYKSVGPDGRVTYSDQPPVGGTTQQLQLDRLPAPVVAPPEPVVGGQVERGKEAMQAPARRGAGGVLLYTADWCGYCQKAKAWLGSKRIAYREIDIDTPKGKEAFARAGGGGIPLLVAGERRLRGFSSTNYDELFASRRTER